MKSNDAPGSIVVGATLGRTTTPIGCGMMFQHRYFQDYSAAEYETHYLAQDRGD